MNIAEEFKIGNTRVRIATDYCEGKTKAEVDAILRRIAEITLPYLQKGGESSESVHSVHSGGDCGLVSP